MKLTPRLLLLALFVTASPASAGDWPQFMRDAAHTGDAGDEALQLPLGLLAQVKLDDAVHTSPAVVAGRVYVVDQMGTAYCVDPGAGRVVWKSAPDGDAAMGANTSSPCVAAGPAQACQTVTGDDGRFTVKTHVAAGEYKSGMVPGEYRVAVSKLDTANVESPFTPPKNTLPEKYAAPQTSGFTVTVSADNENDFTLPLVGGG